MNGPWPVRVGDLERREPPSPKTTAVQGPDIIRFVVVQCRPVTENDARLSTGPSGDLKPGQPGFGLTAWGPFYMQCQIAVRIAVTHAGKAVGNEAQAFHAPEVFGPTLRLIAVHVETEIVKTVAAQRVLEFPRVAFSG